MKNYNDYILPSNDEFELMQEKFRTTSKQNTQTIVSRRDYLAHEAISQCYGLEKNVNHRIRSWIERLKKELEKLIDNLTLTFSIQTSIIKNVHKFNMFSLLNKTVDIISNLISLNSIEEKVYIKSFSKNTIISLINNLKYIFNSLENSNVYLFKYL